MRTFGRGRELTLRSLKTEALESCRILRRNRGVLLLEGGTNLGGTPTADVPEPTQALRPGINTRSSASIVLLVDWLVSFGQRSCFHQKSPKGLFLCGRDGQRSTTSLKEHVQKDYAPLLYFCQTKSKDAVKRLEVSTTPPKEVSHHSRVQCGDDLPP